MAEEKRTDSPELEQEVVENRTQEAQEEVVYDDQDPIEVLRATAIQLGLDPEEVAIMSKKELQSVIDRRVTEAIQTREKKLRKQAEIEKLKEKGQWEQLLKQERAEALEDLKHTYMQTKGLPEEFADLIDITPLLDKSLSEAKETLTEAVERVASKLNELIEQKVNERLVSLEKGSFRTNETPLEELPKTREELLALPYEKQVEIFTKYPDIWKKLVGG